MPFTPKIKHDLKFYIEQGWHLITYKLLKKHYKLPISAQFIAYAIIGAIAVSTDFISFYLLYQLLKTGWVNIISYFIGTVVSFTLNRSLNFHVFDSPVKRYLKYLAISLFGAIWSSWLIVLLIKLNISYLISKAIILPIVLIYQYFGSKIIVFK